PVIPERAIADAGEELGRAPVGAQGGERGPLHAAGEDQLLDAGLAQQPESLAGGTETDHRMWQAGKESRIGLAFESEHEERARRDDASWQVARTCHDAEFRRHFPWAGRWRGSSRHE